MGIAPCRPVDHLVRVKDDQVRIGSSLENASLVQAEFSGRQGRHFFQHLLQFQELCFTDILPENPRKGPIHPRVGLAAAEQAIGRQRLSVRADADQRMGQDALEVLFQSQENDHADCVFFLDEEVPHELIGCFSRLSGSFEDVLALKRPVFFRQD